MRKIYPSRGWKLPRIDRKRCVLCGACVDVCPHQVLALRADKLIFSRPEQCVYCATCEMTCPHNAVVCDFSIQWADLRSVL